MGFEENEVSLKANGGTELIKRRIAATVDPELLKEFQIICSRVRTLEQDKIRVYWVHDLPTDPELQHLKTPIMRDRFHKIVFCGNWQYNQFVTMMGLPVTDRLCVIDNAIEPFEKVEKSFDDTIDLVYCASPQRGLALLVPVFTELAKTNEKLRLHVFSSFKIYGWDEADKQFEPVFKACEDHPQIIYHGFQPNDVVRKQLAKSHIYAYPSIWPECNSLAVIEAMSAGLLCVHPNFAGLTDTSGALNATYQMEQDPVRHMTMFAGNLAHAIEIVSQQPTQNYLKFVKAYADTRFNIKKAEAQWKDMLTSLKEAYPDAASRKYEERAMFSYRVQ